MKKDKSATEEQHICACCEHSVNIRESDMCICFFNGAVKADNTCKKYKLDLLKLSPLPTVLPEDGETVIFDI